MKKTIGLIFAILIIISLNSKAQSESLVTYLGHSAWSVKINNNLLVFDYQEKFDFDWGEQKPARNLASGYLTIKEIKDYNVYVFVTHSHIDHFDEIIFDWEDEVENIKYFFGWDYKSDGDYHCLIAPRGEYKDLDLEINTINSHHSGVSESAFLVKIDGVTIYHNGDCKSDYENDFAYLKTKTDKIDIAFSNTDNSAGSHYLKQSLSLINNFGVGHFFPMHSINKEAEYKIFANSLTEKGAKSENHVAKKQGDQFVISK